MNQTWKNGKKTFWAQNRFNWPKFGSPDFFFVGFTSSYHCMQFQGKSFGPDLARLAQFWPAFLFKNLALSATRYHGQLSSCTISEKVMIQSCEKLVTDGRTDKWTDGQTTGWMDRRADGETVGKTNRQIRKIS